MSESSPWAPVGRVASLAHADGDVTLVEGQTFALSGRRGDMQPELPQGLFVLDTRVLSRLELRINGQPLEPLTVAVTDPFAATFVGRGHPAAGRADADVVVFRHRHIGFGMRERIVFVNHGLDPVSLIVELHCDVDFADLFEVKEGRIGQSRRDLHEVGRHRLSFEGRVNGIAKRVTLALSEDPLVEPRLATWHRTLAAGEEWTLCTEVRVRLGETEIEPRFKCQGARDEDAEPLRRLATWRARLPTVETDDPGFAAAMARCGEDLGALRIFDPEHPELAILAAGAPWFMTVFGRDSLLTAWMTLIADPSLAHGVLETLARFQGRDVNPDTEEEPGKILHEMRFGAATGLSLGGGDVYYGSIDATPLFVMLLGELRRWRPDDEATARLLPHADRAIDWIEQFGDRDGDGYVEYQRANPKGLANQGWKDSWDGVRFADGRLPQTPIALCEVQAYVYAAYVARAHFAREEGDDARYEHCRAKAAELRRRFNEDFWVEDRGWFALGLDADKRPIDALASNMGHCLWAGIVEPDKAAEVARHLVSPEMFSGWGVRTLGTSMAAYNPVSYHNGSVWPHDNALCAAGLARYGFIEEAQRIIEGQLAVAATGAGRLPELFAGFERSHLSVPAAYPTSCSPQAWAAAAPLLWLRTLLRLDPWATHGQVWIEPRLPPSMNHLHVEGVQVGGQRIGIEVDRGGFEITGTGDLEVVARGRPPLTAALDQTDATGATGATGA